MEFNVNEGDQCVPPSVETKHTPADCALFSTAANRLLTPDPLLDDTNEMLPILRPSGTHVLSFAGMRRMPLPLVPAKKCPALSIAMAEAETVRLARESNVQFAPLSVERKMK